MPSWIAWGTFAAAVAGVVLAAINTVVIYRRGRRAVRIAPVVVEWLNPDTALVTFKVVNPGHVPVAIQECTLTGRPEGKPRAMQLRDSNGNPRMPRAIQPGDAMTVTLGISTMREPLMLELYTVRVETQEGLCVERFEHALRKLAMQLKAAESQT